MGQERLGNLSVVGAWVVVSRQPRVRQGPIHMSFPLAARRQERGTWALGSSFISMPPQMHDG